MTRRQKRRRRLALVPPLAVIALVLVWAVVTFGPLVALTGGGR